MAIPLSIEPEPYVLEEDAGKPDEEQTTFLLRNFTAAEWAALVKTMTKKDGVLEIVGEGANQLLAKHLVGWTNFNEPDGTPVEFNVKTPTKNLDRLTAAQRTELAAALVNRNTVKGADSKNSP